jgi:GMP synthase-like glutamine amidotransferase
MIEIHSLALRYLLFRVVSRQERFHEDIAMRIRILQHSPNSPPGSVLDWLQTKHHEHSTIHLYKGEPLPSLAETDWLIILGGPMNVDDVHEHAWLASEKSYLRQAIDAGKTCLGLCLGGQLLAQTLGGTVMKDAHWETGWQAVHLGSSLEANANSSGRLTVFQWHQDAFSLPEGAVRIATNRITENQGFAYGDRVLGLQFHPEASEEWVRHCMNEKEQPTGPHVQTHEQITEGMIYLTPMRRWFFDLLDRMEMVTDHRNLRKSES